NLAMWVFWAALAVFGFVSSLKRMTEAATERYCARRKLRRARACERRERQERERLEREQCEREKRLAALAASAEEPTVIYPTAPALAPKLEPAELDMQRSPWTALTTARLPVPFIAPAQPVPG